MIDSTVGPCSPKDEARSGWGVLLALLAGWGITLRLVLLIGVPIAAVVAIVALVVIYLGTVGVAALLTGGGGGYGIKRLLTRRQRRRDGRRRALNQRVQPQAPAGLRSIVIFSLRPDVLQLGGS
ncbi:MAG: hypothetical protein ACREX8_06885 [Gammaproteobacteria bacterium]